MKTVCKDGRVTCVDVCRDIEKIKPSLTTLEHHLLIAKSLYDPINYCYENHFDIYGLIEKGLAIDATGLNIY